MYERASKNEKSLKAKNRLLKEINDSNEQTIQALHDRIHELSTLQKLQGSVTSDVESQALQACEQTLQDITEIVFHHCKDHKLRQKVSAKYEKYELVAARSVISKPELVEVESSESSAS